MQALLGTTVLAEAEEADLVRIEGNWYFPPASITAGVLTESPTAYTCPWKGACQYYSVVDGDAVQQVDAAWAYLTPFPSAIERVGSDFSGYVAFSPQVKVVS
ncbi:uncharacterized protein (DUF427 family) [Microbacterium halimionae]|uniref:Uncharacterized protein (DUF427 family) n=1 Tax=Microbacterium halimionae TaxID=1526413 RepID=A0A7W3JMZ7_9MICO|nr:DUF427 domain-containing protein [Microbacterium halimionae]MBA8815780.1 uncharacterized protein (DUF427 family) [Microbacterium halimionae]NII95826.1 uncharacterized protein (DUF427 family) [Microbacterium halimionae]